MKLAAGQVAVVTGAASGIGRALATALAEAGLRVVLADVEAPALDAAVSDLRASGHEVLAAVTDVSHYQELESLRDRALATFGQVDILVNNAGVDLMLPVPGGDDDTVHRVFDVNFFAAVAATLAVVPGMAARGFGIIVNTSSDTARAPEPRQGAYAASKAALSAFSESVAHEVADRGVHVHVLYPGWVPTAMGLSGNEDGGSLPPRWVRRTAEQVANLTADRMGGPRIDINAARLPLLAPIARALAPLSYQRAMRRMATT